MHYLFGWRAVIAQNFAWVFDSSILEMKADDSSAYSGWLKRCGIFRRARLVIRETTRSSVFCKKYAEKNGSPFAYKHANRGRQSEIFITHPPDVRYRVPSVSLRGSSPGFCLSRAKFIDGYHCSSVFLSIPSCTRLPASNSVRYQIPIMPS